MAYSRDISISLLTDASWNGLTAAEMAEKELAESGVAEGRMGLGLGRLLNSLSSFFSPSFFAPYSNREPVHTLDSFLFCARIEI